MSSLHNAISYGVDLLRAFPRAIGLSDEAGVERISETLTPVMDVWSQPEWNFLRNERFVGLRYSSAAFAAELSGVALLNPAGSNYLITALAATGRPAAAGVFLSGLTTQISVQATFALQGAGLPLDTRVYTATGTVAKSIGQVWIGTDAAAIGQILDEIGASVATNQSVDLMRLPVILSPGFAWFSQFNVVNTFVSGGIFWRERRMFPGEQA